MGELLVAMGMSTKAAGIVSGVATIASMGAQVIGGIQQANAQKAAGAAALQQAEFQKQVAQNQADQLEINANSQRATSQQAAIAENKRRKQMVETIRNRAGGGLDPSTVNVTAGVEGAFDANVGNILAEGEQNAQDLEFQAQLARAGGDLTLYGGQVENRLQRAKSRRTILSTASGFGKGLVKNSKTLSNLFPGSPPSPLYTKSGKWAAPSMGYDFYG